MAEPLDRILEDGYLGDLAELPMDEVRARRAECQEIETGLSMLRRLAQGRLDIVGLEQARRAEGGDPDSLPDLIARLPEVLSDRTRSEGPGRLPQLLAPGALDSDLEAELEQVASSGSVTDLPRLSDDELRAMAEALEALEAKVSAHRRLLFGRIDALQAEITRRYRDGEATVDSLLG
jgi:hypothetical protein